MTATGPVAIEEQAAVVRAHADALARDWVARIMSGEVTAENAATATRPWAAAARTLELVMEFQGEVRAAIRQGLSAQRKRQMAELPSEVQAIVDTFPGSEVRMPETKAGQTTDPQGMQQRGKP